VPSLAELAFQRLAERLDPDWAASTDEAQAWETTEGISALLQAARAAERRDDATAADPPGRGASHSMAGLLAEARRWKEARDHGELPLDEARRFAKGEPP
jgi:hypothetical protein